MWHSSVASKRQPPTPKPNLQESLSSQRPPIPFSLTTLNEALKNNPFRGKSTVDTLVSDVEDPVVSLNNDLKLFANIYPDVKIEVLRELLTRFDGESRLHICTEQLLKYNSEWARGRLLSPPRDLDDKISPDELFRHREYIAACRQTLLTEFKGLNRSAVDAVLAEVNHSYKQARPVLQEIVAKSWRATITSLFRKRKTTEEPPSFLVGRGKYEHTLASTGNAELDKELKTIFLVPVLSRRMDAQMKNDFDLATSINQEEAEQANALFECQCCYNDVPFEQITACTADAHVICHDCVRRSLSEALFGQNWSKAVNVSYGTLHCLFPSRGDECSGSIPPSILQTAIVTSKSGQETWLKFEQRLAIENLTQSRLALTHCPCCNYAEARQNITFNTASEIKWQFRFRLPTFAPELILPILLLEIFLPIIGLFILLLYLLSPSLVKRYFYSSLVTLSAKRHTKIFICRHPSCGRRSCLSCHKPWHDPHTCHEPLILSLRTTVESARTAALKRTCPRCNTSFVKSSGCNKLVCVCGYAMCYLCRKNIGKTTSTEMDFNVAVPPYGPLGMIGRDVAGARARREEEMAIRAAGEGYRHFCEHFRPLAGVKCTECDKCDLYKTENEDEIVRRAGEEAERLWREQHKEELSGGAASNTGDEENPSKADNSASTQFGRMENNSLDEAIMQFGHRGGFHGESDDLLGTIWNTLREGRWTIQSVVDRVVETCIVVLDTP